jgi:RNA ligase (TIGR02306 family)
MSTHRCEVVPVTLEPHPDADTLSIVRIEGYQVVVKTAEWQGVDRGVYIPPDYVVADGDERFAFLAGSRRVRVRRFRGVVSQGLLMPAPAGAELGEDFMERWGITHYQTMLDEAEDKHALNWALGCSVRGLAGDNVPGPNVIVPVYDIEPYPKYARAVFHAGEAVIVTEKIHGCNARYVFTDGQMYCGSRRWWKKDSEGSIWWRALRACPWIEAWCRNHPGMVLFGEIFGQVQDLRYGSDKGTLFFAAFDILDGARWLPWCEFVVVARNVRTVPLVAAMAYDDAKIREIAETDSLLAPHCKEGVVVKPFNERTDARIGRVQLKLVSNCYLERAA